MGTGRQIAIREPSGAWREGAPYVVCLAALAIAVWRWHRGVAAGISVLACGCLFFFRDPVRPPPTDHQIIYAAADGRVLRIDRVEHEQCLSGAAVRIVIFLSLVDIHVNRAPIWGRIAFLERRRGGFGPAFSVEASDRNAAELLAIDGDHGRVLVRRTAGLLARRIVTWKEAGQEVAAGEKLGMLKFGSRTDLLFPEGVADVLIREGSYVQAGRTAIARYRDRPA